MPRPLEIDILMRTRVDATLARSPKTGLVQPGPSLVERLVNVVKLRELRERLGLRLVDEWDRPDQEHLWDVYERVVLEGKHTVEDWGGSLCLVLPAGAGRLRARHRPPTPRRVPHPGRAAGYPHDRPVRDLSEHPDPLSLFPPRLRIITPHVDLHYGEEGHRLVAETVLSELAGG